MSEAGGVGEQQGHCYLLMVMASRFQLSCIRQNVHAFGGTGWGEDAGWDSKLIGHTGACEVLRSGASSADSQGPWSSSSPILTLGEACLLSASSHTGMGA